MRRQYAPRGTPGPGTHAMVKGIGSALKVPPSGLPRAHPFHSPHLRALGSLRPSASECAAVWGGAWGGAGPPPAAVGSSSPKGGTHAHGAWLAERVGSPTAHVISYAPVPATPAQHAARGENASRGDNA